jgi:hypothetical protein
MCSEVPPPPPVIPSPPPDPTLATRERYAQHTKDGNCRGCHSLFDNAGYGLENYDGFGRWRTEDHGKPIDLTGLDVAKIPFESLEGLASTLAARSSGCAARQWFRYALGRRERADDDLCTLPALEAAFAKGGGRTRALLEAIATSDAFLTAAR